MSRVRTLITGMSGTGKSSVIAGLAAGGYDALDSDTDGWSELVPLDEADPYGGQSASDWVWRIDRMQSLLESHTHGLLFVSGCASNQGLLYPSFERIILLSAPRAVLIERLLTRTTNTYGKTPAELADTLTYIDTVEPLLRQRATLEIDTSQPLSAVIEQVLQHARC